MSSHCHCNASSEADDHSLLVQSVLAQTSHNLDVRQLCVCPIDLMPVYCHFAKCAMHVWLSHVVAIFSSSHFTLCDIVFQACRLQSLDPAVPVHVKNGTYGSRPQKHRTSSKKMISACTRILNTTETINLRHILPWRLLLRLLQIYCTSRIFPYVMNLPLRLRTSAVLSPGVNHS